MSYHRALFTYQALENWNPSFTYIQLGCITTPALISQLECDVLALN